MKTKTRNILIVAGVIALFFIGVIGYGAYGIYSFFTQFAPREIPADLKEARVFKGNEIFTRTEFFKLDKEGFLKLVNDAAQIKDEKERETMLHSRSAIGIHSFADIRVSGDNIIAVGAFGGFVFDLSGNLKKQIFFEPTVKKVKIGPYEKDTYQSALGTLRIAPLEHGKLGFLSYDSTQGVRVFDGNGKEIWTTGRDPADLSLLLKGEEARDAELENRIWVLEAGVGDLDNDGVSEYIVGRRKDGLRAYDRNGNEKWFVPADFPGSKLVVIDLDGDGKNELVELGESVRDGNGKMLREMEGNGETAMLTVDQKTQKTRIEFLSILDGKLTCSGENGETMLEGPAPLSEVKKEAKRVDIPGDPEMSSIDDTESAAFPQGVWITLKKGEPPYLALVARFIGIPRANLYIYRASGELVYHELLDQEAETIAILPAADGKDSLLIGGTVTIWRYTPN